MKCVVPGANIKILAKAIHALAKIGDEMYVEPRKDAISFRTVNLANSAYADFTFLSNYFSYYIYGDLQEEDALKCKISMRSAMAVFKAPNLLDKQVETCHIKLEPDASEILFILKYKNSITKTHLLPILDCEVLQTAYNKENASNQVSSQPRVLADAIQNFHQNLIEVTLEVSPQKLLLRNYVDDASGISNTTRTQLVLGIGEFDRYVIGTEATITFCMKEFKALLNFAETIGLPIGVYFEIAGRPVIFSLKNPAFEVNLILSTLSSDLDSQTDTTLVGQRERSMQRKSARKTSKRTNKSKSRTENRSTKVNKTPENPRVSFAEERVTRSENLEKQSTSKRDVSRTIVTETRTGQVSVEPSYPEISESNSSCNSLNSKKLINSIFSNITKRKSNTNDGNKEKNRDMEVTELEEAVANSPPPPAKKARLIFQKCFQKTFDPSTLPGYDVILAEDSDECCSE